MFKFRQRAWWLMAMSASAIAAWAGGGCAMTAPAPGGRLRTGAYTQFQPTWAIAYSPATATVTDARANVYRVQTNTDERGLGVLTAPIPINVGLRQTVGRHMDINAAAGYASSGLELRVGPADEGQRIPWVASVGARSGKVGLIGDGSYEGRLRLEAYLALRAAEPGLTRIAVFGGLSAGLFGRVFPLPGEPSGDVILSTPSAHVFRPEVRLESGIGVHGRTPSFAYLVAVSPWFLLANGSPRSRDGTTISELANSSGVALLLGLSLGSDHGSRGSAGPFSR